MDSKIFEEILFLRIYIHLICFSLVYVENEFLSMFN